MKTGPKKADRCGERFGRWLVISEAPNRGRHTYWNCRCDCGVERVVGTFTLTAGQSVSCGCMQKEGGPSTSNYRHGASKTPIYWVWVGMRSRCHSPTEANFKNYGGRGISVCERWQTFENFRDDMLPSWRSGLTIERVDVNGNYEPSNCVWATQYEQMQNVRHAVYLDTPWGRLTCGAAARRIGIDRSALRDRIKRGVTAPDLFAKAYETGRAA